MRPNLLSAAAPSGAQRLGRVQPVTPPAVALVLLAGTLQAASLAWPFDWQVAGVTALGFRAGQPVWWLQVLALALLARLLTGNRNAVHGPGSAPAWRRGALWGWLFATGWLTATFNWLFVAMHTYGALPGPLAAAAVLALAGLLALYYALVCGLFVALAEVNRAFAAIIFAVLWMLAELARGRWLTGFGWGATGYSQLDGPLAAYAPWIGVYGLCALSAWLAISLVQLVRPAVPGQTQRRAWLAAAPRLCSMLAVLALPVLLAPNPADDKLHSTGSLALTLLQGNIPQSEKFESDSGVPLALQWYGEQLLASRTSLVIAPETAIPVLPKQLPDAYWQTLQQRFTGPGQAALIGIPLGNYQVGYTNSVLGLKGGQAEPWRYDKQHLVPFGEFIPPAFKWFTAMMNIPLGDFNRGAASQAPFDWQGQRLATNICFEDLFGEELARSFADPALAPTLFVNLSNLAWFGNGQALDQHLQIARMRALEFDRALVLATNTGTSAIVDHRGQIIASVPRETRAVLVSTVEGRSGITPYAWWTARGGLWPLWLLALATLLLAWQARRQRHAIENDAD